ncbi:MAG: hypothetical protein CM15mV16_0050 [uncultured marine virus]|nr:MAG: hypothetical protein CM15mV16_0050 [uncultured marine virus]
MFGTYFYHKRVRSAVSVFGSLFNNLFVLRKNSAGETISQVKVPLSYAPKRNFISRLEAMNSGEQAERRVAIKLPRMSFEITSITYDNTRQLNKMNSLNKVLSGSTVSRQKIFSHTPYNINFDLNIYAKSQDDALQIVEQIFPFFTPQYTVTVKPFSNIADLTEDVPITLTSTNFSDDFEGAIEQRRTIIYTLSFEMKVNFYGPLNTSKIIREVSNNLFIMDSAQDSGDYLKTIQITPTPSGVSADSDYGFNEVDSDNPSNI